MSSRRSKLFNYLRFCFFANVFLFICVVAFWVYTRFQRTRLVDLVQRQFAHNLLLSSKLAEAQDILTNRYFSAASSFASNILFSVASSSSSAALSLPDLSTGISSDVDLPPVDFRRYFEHKGKPYIMVRNKYYGIGDYILGCRIEDISPDVVKFGGKYYKVLPNE